MMRQASYTIRSKWIFPVDRPPIENGLISIRAGRVASVDATSGLVADLELGDAILFPQFVNAHTHLEFSECVAPLGPPRSTFASWIKRVIDSRRGIDKAELATQTRSAIQRGLAESRSAAVAAVGEISSQIRSSQDYASPSPRCVIFHERLGLSRDSVAGAVAELEAMLKAARDGPRPWQFGISPHAPYSTHIELVRGLVEFANGNYLPVAMHLAESREELELLETRRGPLRQLLDELGVWHANAIPAGVEMMDYLKLLASNERSLVIHGNYLTANELDFIACNRQRMHVVFCPRTNAFFGHEPYPLSDFLRRNISLSIATDSRASNPDLSMANEIVYAAAAFPEIEPSSWLQMTTLNPARAIGVDADFGSISPGKLPQFAVIALPNGLRGNPEALWLEAIASCRPLQLQHR